MPVTTLYSGCTECCLDVVPVDCCGCSALPRAYRLPVSGFDPGPDGLCDEDCGNFNDDWTLNLDEETCTYLTDDSGTCNTGEPTWQMFCDDTYWYLVTTSTAGTTTNQWRKLRSEWNCLGTNTLDLTDTNFCASGIPATLTVIPV